MTDIENKIREAWNAITGPNWEYDEKGWESRVIRRDHQKGESITAAARHFRDGYLAAHQEAAAQIAEKDAEIENLRAGVQRVGIDLAISAQKLTAAREREEKAVALIEAYAGGWGFDPWGSAFRDSEKEITEARAAYDARRAEKKEDA
jgi:hypothetical protein